MQFLITHCDPKRGIFEIEGEEARHISQVLRKKPGEVLRLFDGKGAVLWGEIQKADSERVSGRLMEAPPESARPYSKISYKIRLYQALPKGAKWDWVLEKGCELGISSFTPILSERTVVKISKEEAPKKLERWKKILEAASKQSGVLKIPEIKAPVSLKTALESASKSGDVILFCWESELTELLPKAVSKFNSGRDFALFIGPEGGWSLSEVEDARGAGAICVGLGPNVLRTETAPIAAAAMIQASRMISE